MEIPAIGVVPFDENMDPRIHRILGRIVEAVELLAGNRGEQGNLSKAIQLHTVQDLSTPAVDPLRVQLTVPQFDATGAGFSIEGTNVPSLDDYGKALDTLRSTIEELVGLANDVQSTMNRVATLETKLNQLIGALQS